MTTVRRRVLAADVLTTRPALEGEPQLIPAGRIVGAVAIRDYPEDIAARKLRLYVETYVQVRVTGEATQVVGGDAQDVVVVRTDTDVPPGGVHLTTVLDGDELAWHVYGVAAPGRPYSIPGLPPAVRAYVEHTDAVVRQQIERGVWASEVDRARAIEVMGNLDADLVRDRLGEVDFPGERGRS